jgi:hypothetical protein
MYKAKIYAEQEESTRLGDLIDVCTNQLSECQKRLAQSTASAPNTISSGKSAALLNNRIVLERRRLDRALAANALLHDQVDNKRREVWPGLAA